MRLERRGRKWIVEGDGKGWVFNKKFSTKWSANLAIEVYAKGGTVSDYWKAKREHPKREMNACRVRGQLQRALEEIQRLNPIREEIEEYGKDAGYGEVTYTIDMRYHAPRLHDTWGLKYGGRVHIDIGSGGTHLMLDKDSVRDFIQFLETKRKSNNKLA